MGLRDAHASDMPRVAAGIRTRVRLRTVEISNTAPARCATAVFKIGTPAVLRR
jgi:hypothetical protein